MRIVNIVAAALIAATASSRPTTEFDPVEFVRTLDAAAVRNVWPGFDPSIYPIALYDGTRTYLFHHPSPPAGFAPMPDRPGVLALDGAHPAVVGNSTVEIGGVRTATFIARPGASAVDARGTIVEELFHVFWRSRHANGRPDEMARYAYPVTDARVLGLRLAEEEALARALEAESPAQAAGWAAAALRTRRERRPLLAADVAAFETELELLEGTANSVARMFVGERPEQSASPLRREWAADEIRWRFYESGAAVCLLLDRLRPGWKAEIDASQELTIERLLDEALARTGAKPAEFAADDLASFSRRGAAAAAELTDRRRKTRDELIGRDGARIEIEVPAGAEPFRLTRFHPLNLMVLDGLEVAHTAYLTLSLPDGSIEVRNPAFARRSFAGTVALTAGGEGHPLGAIRKVTVVGVRGVKADPSGGRLVIEADGVRASFAGAAFRVEGETYRVSWPGKK